jgi:Mrp family chromosome partitioning ATPase/capsular polysaccharide biosynthesis protein
MELAFVIDSVRRYFWVVAIAVVFGVGAAVLLQGRGPEEYRSSAVLLLVPPADASSVALSGDNERYVSGQLAYLGSAGLAEGVADSLDDGITGAVVQAVMSFNHVPSTDVVEVTATTGDPARSQQIADAFVDRYIESLREQLEAAQGPELERLEGELETMDAELADIDEQIRDRMAPFLENPESGDAIPTLEQVAPDLVSDKALLLDEYERIQDAKIDLELNARKVATVEVQAATLPAAPVPTGSKILLAAGLVGGGFMGLVAAVLLARLSPQLLGPRHAEDILGQPLVGTFPKDAALTRSPATLLRSLPDEVMVFADLACVRAEASSQTGSGSLVVVVIGADRGAGATTLATVMANRFATQGSEVLLVDADSRDPDITAAFGPNAKGVHDLLAIAPDLPDLRDKADPDLAECLRNTSVPNLRVLGLGQAATAGGLRRQHASPLIAVTSRIADVVVIDGGPLMEASSTVQLAHLADAVVLLIPERQKASGLEVVGRQLRGRRGSLLTVWSAGHRGRGTGDVEPTADLDADREDADDAFSQLEQYQGSAVRPTARR